MLNLHRRTLGCQGVRYAVPVEYDVEISLNRLLGLLVARPMGWTCSVARRWPENLGVPSDAATSSSPTTSGRSHSRTSPGKWGSRRAAFPSCTKRVWPCSAKCCVSVGMGAIVSSSAMDAAPYPSLAPRRRFELMLQYPLAGFPAHHRAATQPRDSLGWQAPVA